jgi:hypothetical protein
VSSHDAGKGWFASTKAICPEKKSWLERSLESNKSEKNYFSVFCFQKTGGFNLNSDTFPFPTTDPSSWPLIKAT